MAQFRVGQRVKFINVPTNNGLMGGGAPIGGEGTVSRLAEKGSCWDWVCHFPNCPAPANGNLGADEYYADSCQLAPLTDPGSDAFMERIRKLGDEPINTVEKEKVTR